MPNNNSSSKEKRSRNWATVCYPDSLPDNWQDILRDQFIDCLISPLHDKDKDGEEHEKKAHYHVLCAFSSMKSKDQVLEIFSKFGGVGAERVNDFRSYARYLCHLDHPHKASYSPDNVISIGSLDYLSIIKSAAEKYEIVSDMMKYIDSHTDTIKFSYSRFMRYCRDNEELWFRALCDNCSYVIKEYLTSAEWEYKQNLEHERQVQYYNDCCNSPK